MNFEKGDKDSDLSDYEESSDDSSKSRAEKKKSKKIDAAWSKKGGSYTN